MTVATTLKDVDLALAARYAGISIPVEAPGGPVVTPVDVFPEEPATEAFPERVYPSISLKLVSLNPNFEEVHTCTDLEEEVGYNESASPPERDMRQSPFPFRVTYSLDTWHKVRVGESRDLVAETMIRRTPPRGAVTVPLVGGGTHALWVFWSGGIATLDEPGSDETIYHKSLTVDVLASLLVDAEVTTRKVVTSAQWAFVHERALVSPDGRGVVVVPGEGFLDLTMKVDQDGDRPI